MNRIEKRVDDLEAHRASRRHEEYNKPNILVSKGKKSGTSAVDAKHKVKVARVAEGATKMNEPDKDSGVGG